MQQNKGLLKKSNQVIYRRRRKRRDQSPERKGEKPQNFNLPQIPHCFSTAASYAASSLTHKFPEDSSSHSCGYNMRRTDVGNFTALQSSSIHAADLAGVNMDMNVSPSDELSMQDSAENVTSRDRHKPSRLDQMHEQGNPLAYHVTSSSSDDRVIPTDTSTVFPDYRPITSQTQVDASRFSEFSNISTYSTSFVPQAPSAHYSNSYSFGLNSVGASNQVVSSAQCNPQPAAQRHTNFSVNNLIQRSCSKM